MYMNTEPENLTDEDRAIGHIANNMIESVTFRQQIDIVRDFCFLKAEQFYKGLDDKEKKEIGWGHQIRSYVLQPYRLVKDNRTNFESTSPDKVLDGDIDEFLEQSLYKLNEK